MPIFGRKATAKPSLPAVGDALVAAYEAASTDREGRIRVEDLLSAAAAVCGEACIAAAGEFNPEEHTFVPGAAVLSDRVNQILCADAHEWDGAGQSVFGIIRAGALLHGYATEDFPPIIGLIRSLVASLGSDAGDPAAT